MSQGNVQPLTDAQQKKQHWKYDERFYKPALDSFYGELRDRLESRHRRKWNKAWNMPGGTGEDGRLRRKANAELADFKQKYFSGYGLAATSDEEEIKYFSIAMANKCRRHRFIPYCRELAEKADIEPPEMTTPTIDGYKSQIKRFTCFKWWRKKIRKVVARKTEAAFIEIGKVHRYADKYVSNNSIERLNIRCKSNRELLESLTATNEDGFSLTLQDAQDKSVANPVNRRNELMCRLDGMQTIANEMGLAADFYTITCPSRFHARLSGKGEENPSYDGSTPREAQRYLCELWAKTRAKIHREGISVFGFRIAEPHHDGCPHWHMLLWVEPSQRDATESIIRSYALEDCPTERGAEKHRCKVEGIDPEKGSAVSYIAKYISKNIDGYAMTDDDAKGATRVRAWASTWGIRQFQQVGGVPVGVWRELRRIEMRDESLGDLNNALITADMGNFAGYVRAQGGIFTKREDLNIKLLKVWSDKIGEYGDALGWQVKGIEYRGLAILSRLHNWKITRNSKVTTPWSSVNNCTQPIGKYDHELVSYEDFLANAPPLNHLEI